MTRGGPLTFSRQGVWRTPRSPGLGHALRGLPRRASPALPAFPAARHPLSLWLASARAALRPPAGPTRPVRVVEAGVPQWRRYLVRGRSPAGRKHAPGERRTLVAARPRHDHRAARHRRSRAAGRVTAQASARPAVSTPGPADGQVTGAAPIRDRLGGLGGLGGGRPGPVSGRTIPHHHSVNEYISAIKPKRKGSIELKAPRFGDWRFIGNKHDPERNPTSHRHHKPSESAWNAAHSL